MFIFCGVEGAAVTGDAAPGEGVAAGRGAEASMGVLAGGTEGAVEAGAEAGAVPTEGGRGKGAGAVSPDAGLTGRGAPVEGKGIPC